MTHEKQIHQTTVDLLVQMGLEAEVMVSFDTASDMYQIQINLADPALLIGYHGDTLASFQLILAQHVKAATEQWLNLAVNVNDYREKREDAIHQLTDNTVVAVQTTGKAHTLPPMPANERRVVHMHLSDHPDVTTESVGEGRTRSVIISPRVK